MVLKDMRAILFNFAKNAVTTLCLSTRDILCHSISKPNTDLWHACLPGLVFKSKLRKQHMTFESGVTES